MVDPYAAVFQRVMSIVAWGRPAGEYWPKRSMLEMMGVIQCEADARAFLRKIAARCDFFPREPPL